MGESGLQQWPETLLLLGVSLSLQSSYFIYSESSLHLRFRCDYNQNILLQLVIKLDLAEYVTMDMIPSPLDCLVALRPLAEIYLRNESMNEDEVSIAISLPIPIKQATSQIIWLFVQFKALQVFRLTQSSDFLSFFYVSVLFSLSLSLFLVLSLSFSHENTKLQQNVSRVIGTADVQRIPLRDLPNDD